MSSVSSPTCCVCGAVASMATVESNGQSRWYCLHHFCATHPAKSTDELILEELRGIRQILENEVIRREVNS